MGHFEKCKYAESCGHEFCLYEDCIDFEAKQMTNGDWIRGMTDKEFIEFLGHNCLCDRIQSDSNWCEKHKTCEGCLEEWLKQPVEVEDGE